MDKSNVKQEWATKAWYDEGQNIEEKKEDVDENAKVDTEVDEGNQMNGKEITKIKFKRSATNNDSEEELLERFSVMEQEWMGNISSGDMKTNGTTKNTKMKFTIDDKNVIVAL